MSAAGYRLSFTTGGLLRAEAAAVADLILATGDIQAARELAVSNNVVQQRTVSSRTRVTREVMQRLGELPPSGVRLMVSGSFEETRHVMWLAACLRYEFLRAFGREVIHSRYMARRSLLTHDDFDTFWNLQSSWVDELRDSAETTRRKLRQNTFRMLREAGLLTADSHVVPVLPSPAATEVILESSPDLLLSFPIDDAQIELLRSPRSGVQ